MTRSSFRLIYASVLAWFAVSTDSLTAAEAPVEKTAASSAQGLRYFETHIRPLLVKHCQKCHGAEKQEGSLRIDTYAGLMKGGDSGASVVPGKDKQSLLLTAVGYRNETLQMPPDGKLPDREIAKLIHWVKIGAPHPDAEAKVIGTRRMNIVEGRKFWAFRKPERPPLPQVKNRRWTTEEIDRYVLKKLEEAGLEPAPRCDKQTLIRRTTFDLTGLPPTPEEVDAFLQDDSPNAFARVVDRLLNSPAYGQRWARHWLDVVRYADSNGLDENIAHGNAWRYRDYVIESFNQDKPFDEFLVEQLAGDLLPATGDADVDYARLIATGFLSLGPKVLAEVDETKMEMDIIDEQIDTLGRSFMGLTLGCARCHDHKFDPIATADYYALAGVFKSTKTMEHYKKIARWWEVPIPTPAEKKQQEDHAQQLTGAKAAVDRFITDADRQALATLPEGTAVPDNLEAKYPDATKAELKKLRDAVAKLEKNPPNISTAMGVGERETKDVAVHIRGSHLTLGDVAPRRFPTVLGGENQEPFPKDRSGRLRLARWLTSGEHPLTARVIVNRVWRWHFGRGLVGSPDNFGNLGERPVNQELLDWLAVEFQESGWSFKRLHRRILLSSTWQMSSRPNERAMRIDPENRLQWRAPIRRLEAEAIRDSILAVSGQLDQTMGGSLLHVKNRAFLFDHTSKDETKYDSKKRSVYLPVIRNHLYEVFTLFDYSDAGSVVGNRTTSVVAPQALFMMNSDFTRAVSRAFASQLLTLRANDDGDRVEHAYRLALSRSPSAQERANAIGFLRKSRQLEAVADSETDREQVAWSLLCQVLLSSNEFVYVR